MKLDKAVASLIDAQNNHDSHAYAECFSETAIVHDEGKTYNGKSSIRQWNENANHEYRTVMKALKYEKREEGNVLTAEISGNFPGSPAVLKFHLGLKGNLINSLSVL